jgi:hypothetical protein
LGRKGLRHVDWAALEAFIAKKPSRIRTTDNLYEPLEKGEIRILELFPAAFDAPFEGELHIASIDFEYPQETISDKGRMTLSRNTNNAVSLISKSPMWYTALSYTWGSPIFNQRVRIGKHFITITFGLAAAMQHLRSASQTIFLWIDQICINQRDLKEKETQVPLMGLVYTHATNTLIWLGEDDGADPQLAVQAMQDVHTRLQLSYVKVTTDDFEHLQVPPADDRSWWAVRQLLRRWWFTRTWTIQEACLSRHCYMQCGTTVVSWDSIASWCMTLEDSGLLDWLMSYAKLDAIYSNMVTKDLSVPPTGGVVINELQKARLNELTSGRGPEGLGTNSFLNMLVMVRYAAASDPKDKIYAVLGFADAYVKPRYSEDVTYRDVYHEVAVNQVESSLLTCVDAEEPLRPSWVPDWNTPRVTQALAYSSMAMSVYSAGGPWTIEGTTGGKILPGPFPRFTVSEDKRRITRPGVLFDKIAKLGAISIDPILCIDPTQMAKTEWASYVQLADNMLSNATYSSTNNSVYNAFFQTLLAGRDSTGIAAPSPDHSEVFSLILDNITHKEPSLPGQVYSVRRKKGHFTLASLVAKKGAKVRRPVLVLEDMRIALRAVLHMRRFAVTERGYFALVPRGARVGDAIVVFKRSCVPFLVRSVLEPRADDEVFELVGETYVHGIMKGEAMDMHELPLRDVTLV